MANPSAAEARVAGLKFTHGTASAGINTVDTTALKSSFKGNALKPYAFVNVELIGAAGKTCKVDVGIFDPLLNKVSHSPEQTITVPTGATSVNANFWAVVGAFYWSPALNAIDSGATVKITAVPTTVKG